MLRLHFCKIIGVDKPSCPNRIQLPHEDPSSGRRCPPLPEEPIRKPKPRPIEFPEDRFIQSFYDRYPHIRQTPLDLASNDPPVARRYALRALELMQCGSTPKQARRLTDREFQAAGLLNPPVSDAHASSVAGIPGRQSGPGTSVLCALRSDNLTTHAFPHAAKCNCTFSTG